MIDPDVAQELIQEAAEKVGDALLGHLAKKPVQVREDREDRNNTVQNVVSQQQQQYYEPEGDREEGREEDRDDDGNR